MTPAELMCMKVHDPVAVGPHKLLGYLHRIQENGEAATVRLVAFGQEWYEAHPVANLEPDGPFYTARVKQEALKRADGTPTATDLAGWAL